MLSSSERFLSRNRITRQLADALTQRPLVIVVAPMGYGKSIACRDFCKKFGEHVLRLSAKPSWRDPDTFWESAVQGFAGQGISAPRSSELKSFPRDKATLFHVLPLLKEVLLGKLVTVAIDDYQYVSSKPVDDFIETLVREEIPGFKLLLFSRTKPVFALEGLRMQGYAELFGQELLQFTREEARDLFAGHGIEDTDAADAALNFSEGWPVALWISLHRYREQGLLEPVRDIEKIISELFAGYSGQDQRLLLQLSILESFTSRQATFITGEPLAGSRIHELCHQNSFLHYDEVNDRYSMHGLLRSFLAERLHDARTTLSIDVEELHRNAARYALSGNDRLRAIRHFAAAGGEEDQENILRMFDRPDEGILLSRAPDELLRIMRGIPWRIRRRCFVGYLGFIHRYMVRVDRALATDLLFEAEQELASASGLEPLEREKILGEIELIHAVREFNDFTAMSERYIRAGELLRGRSSLVGEKMFWTFNCPHSAFLYLREEGGYKALVKMAKESLDNFDTISGGANAGAFELLRAEYCLETGDGAEAVFHLRKGEYKAAQVRQYKALLVAAFLRSRLHLARGNLEKAAAELTSFKKELEKLGHPLLVYTWGLCQGYIAATCNDITNLPAWILEKDISREQGFMSDCDFSAIVQGKTLAAMNDWARLEAHAESVAKCAEPFQSLFGKIHMEVCKAIAAYHSQMYNPHKAETHLFKALELAAADGIKASIAEYGSHLMPLLQRMSHLYPNDGAIAILTKQTKKYVTLGKDRRLHLTARECDILERAAKGASNAEIGEALGIMTGSVANTLSRIYGKLGVNCRLGAIRKWSLERGGRSSTAAIM